MTDMNNVATTTRFQQVTAAAAGAIICFVVIFAMFFEPTSKEITLSISPPNQAQAAKGDPGFSFTAKNILGLFVIGLISGTFGGMLGMGGGVIKMSFLLFFFSFHVGISKFASLLAYFAIAVGSSYRYLKLKYIMLDIVKILITSSIIGILLGAVIGHYLPRDITTMLLGIFLLFISVVMVKRIVSHYQDVLPQPNNTTLAQGQLTDSCNSPMPASATWKVQLCGFPGGFLSAMLGISGGVVTNPLQQVVANISIKNAIANTLAMACVTTPIACLMILVMGMQAGHFDFWTPVLVGLCLIPGSIIGSQLGPSLTKRMSSVMVYWLFGVVALFMGINMLFFSN